MSQKRSFDRFKELLLKEKSRILREILKMEKEVSELRENEIVKDIGDMSLDNFSEELLIKLEERERKMLEEIERALEKINNGTYGICERCGEPIEEKRLEAKPYARYCISCRKKLEKKGLV